MGLDDGLRERESQTGSRGGGLTCRRRPIEGGEDLAGLLLAHPGPVIRDLHEDSLGSLRHGAGRHRDVTAVWVYFKALLIRLSMTWARRRLSAMTGTELSSCVSSEIPRVTASG